MSEVDSVEHAYCGYSAFEGAYRVGCYVTWQYVHLWQEVDNVFTWSDMHGLESELRCCVGVGNRVIEE